MSPLKPLTRDKRALDYESVPPFSSSLSVQRNHFHPSHYNISLHVHQHRNTSPLTNCKKLMWRLPPDLELYVQTVYDIHKTGKEPQKCCASEKMKPISESNFQKEMPCLFHVSLCFRSEKKKKEKPNKAKAVGLAGYFPAKQRADGRVFSWP